MPGAYWSCMGLKEKLMPSLEGTFYLLMFEFCGLRFSIGWEPPQCMLKVMKLTTEPRPPEKQERDAEVSKTDISLSVAGPNLVCGHKKIRVIHTWHSWPALKGPELVSPVGLDLFCRYEYTNSADQTTEPRPTDWGGHWCSSLLVWIQTNLDSNQLHKTTPFWT